MRKAGGSGVAVTVSLADPVPAAQWEPLPAGVRRRRTRLVEILDPAAFTDAELAGQLAVIADGRAQLAAYEAGLVAELAARRPAETDLAVDQPGHRVEGWGPDRVPAAGVSEFFADELALVLRSSTAAAVSLGERSLVLVHQLPGTWAALADGLIDEPRAKAIVKVLAGQSESVGGPVDPGIVAEVEAQALAWARAGRPRCGWPSAPLRR